MNTGDLTRQPVLSTYRLQLHASFTFDDARTTLQYLAGLGVSHVYLSPIATAAPGSTHGYDVTDPTRLNPELGGEDAYQRLVEEQRRLGLGQEVDIVPNHMGIATGSGNPYWEDVLREGRASAYASMFDVEWEAPPAGRVTLPILDADLDEVVASGDISLHRSGEGSLRVYGHRLPLRPGCLEEWDESEGLRALLDRQHYRLEYWRTAQAQLNYRRFFAIDELIGIRTEDARVFELVHRLPLDLVQQGALDGLRIDHVDGLRDPEAYLATLRAELTTAGAPGAYLVVEKILDAEEALPAWDVDGTTGYDAMNEFTRVLLTSNHLDRLDALDRRITGRAEGFEELADEGRSHVVREVLGGQFARLAGRLYEATRPPDIDAAPFTEALLDLLGHLEPYRTYHQADELDPAAEGVIMRAARRAAASRALQAVGDALIAPPPGAAREAVLSLQQIMPAVQAKGIEDRALYRYRRLIALNEVGGDPATGGETVATFHERMRAQSERWPRRMLTTATHDHKLGEDVRARLLALAELPEEWERTVLEAFSILERLQSRPRVHPADLYLLLQAVVGAMPAGMTQGRAGDEAFPDRIAAYLVKALREAEERTAWVDGDEAYEDAVTTIARRALAGDAFRATLRPLIDVLAPAGAVNSLAQLVLKAGAPGVPDTYQGNELWDFSLVDPDNRRPVDFTLRRGVLAGFEAALRDFPAANVARAEFAPQLLASWRDGRVKAYVLAQALHVRRAQPWLFLGGSYEAVEATGTRERNVIAFSRRAEVGAALVVVPRLPVELTDRAAALWAPDWGDTLLRMPAGLNGGGWHNVFTGESVEPSAVGLREILGAFPVAILVRSVRARDDEYIRERR